jgi:hypothetical protein
MSLLRRLRGLAPLLLVLGCQSRAAPVARVPSIPSKELPAAEREVVEAIYTRELQNGWMDYGWSDRKLNEGPARVMLSDFGGWIVAKPGTRARYGGLTFRYKVGKTPPAPAQPFDVRLETDGGEKFPRVLLEPRHTLSQDGEWTVVLITMDELNPDGRPFDRIIFQGKSKKDLPEIFFDVLGLTWMDPALVAGGKKPVGPATDVTLTVDCHAVAKPISPLIYGIAIDIMKSKDVDFWELGATARRWGGNHNTRYNWKLGHAWNTAQDWFFQNVNYTDDPTYTYDVFLEENLRRKIHTALTIPTIGWVAKDTTSFSFPVSRFGEQESVDQWREGSGNGKNKKGKPIPPGPPTLTSVEASPEFMAEWVKTLRAKDQSRGRSVQMYILDNEPMLWHETHRDIHPQRATYDELLDRTVRYGTAIRRADPDAQIAGPAEWGWSAFFYSAADLGSGVFLRPDRRKHEDQPLIEWYLQKLKEHEKKTGVKLLDVLDLHYYPQGKGMALGDAAATDPEAAALRLRATRSLWDPTYKDESWIDDQVQLIPRMKKWVADFYPGLGTSIGEYNFGAETHMSGGLAQAEALGRFGQHGLTSAFFWMYPPKNSPAFWAFRAYRNFDGQGARFQDLTVPAQGTAQVSLFASRDEARKHYVLVALNLSPQTAVNAQVALNGCALPTQTRTFQYAGDPTGFAPLGKPSKVPKATLPPYSMTVFDVQLQ